MNSDRIELSDQDYRALARFRYLLRHFLQFSEEAARAEGLEAQQHQMMLAIRASDEGGPTVGMLAEQFFIRHHSAVGLADRMQQRGLVERVRDEEDGRQVRLRLTRQGEILLARLAQAHHAELRNLGPELVAALEGLLKGVPAR